MKIDFKVSGHFTIEATNTKTGKRRKLAEFDNLITNQGLDRLGNGGNGFMYYCHLGSGSAAPAVTDTSLQTLVAVSGNRQAESDGAQSSVAPFYLWKRSTYRFDTGAAAGNLSEVGVGWNNTAGNLFSRALILDSGGNPTTITILSDEVLDVTYEFRLYADTGTTTGSVVISGVTYNTTAKLSEFNSSNRIWTLNAYGFDYEKYFRGFSGSLSPTIFDGPTGSSASGGFDYDPYVPGSHERTGKLQAGLNDINVGGIKSIQIFTMFFRWQIEFNVALPKDNTKVLSLNCKVTWGRYAP